MGKLSYHSELFKSYLYLMLPLTTTQRPLPLGQVTNLKVKSSSILRRATYDGTSSVKVF